MKGTLGQTVMIENVTGAGGTIGTARPAHAAPDGYTLSVGNVGTHVINPATYPNIQYHPLGDFEPVALLATSAYWIIAKRTFPANDLKELIEWLKANPDKATAAMVGTGGLDQIAGTYFQQKTGTRFQFVPYRGAALAIQDMVAGIIDLKFDVVAVSSGYVRSGQLKAYAIMGKDRSHVVPEIPTAHEFGVQALNVSFWSGLWAPKSTSKPVVTQLNAAVTQAFADPTVQHRISDLGAGLPPPELRTSEAFGAFHKTEIEKWWPFIRTAGIKAE